MAYFDNTNNTDFYPLHDISGELGFYPFAEQTSATEEIGMVENSTFSDWWGMVGQLGPVTCPPTNPWTTVSNCGECQSNAFIGRCLDA